MRLYWEVARRGFRRFATYRGATFAGVFTNTVFGFLKAYVLLALYEHRADVGGFDAQDAVTFVFVSQGFLAAVGAFGSLEIAERIKTGDVVSDLYRPIDFQAYWLAQDLGRAAFQAVFRGIPPALVGAAVFDLVVPSSPLVVAAFLVSLVFAVVISFTIRFLASLTAFWLIDERGAVQIAGLIALFMTGFVVPVNFFPGWLADVARVLPWAAYVQLPIEVFLGKHDGAALVGVLALQVVWAVTLLGAGRLVLAAATRKLVVQGG